MRIGAKVSKLFTIFLGIKTAIATANGEWENNIQWMELGLRGDGHPAIFKTPVPVPGHEQIDFEETNSSTTSMTRLLLKMTYFLILESILYTAYIHNFFHLPQLHLKCDCCR